MSDFFLGFYSIFEHTPHSQHYLVIEKKALGRGMEKRGGMKKKQGDRENI